MDAPSVEFNNDVFVIADAFRRASEEDTRLVLNAMAAKKTPSSQNDLKFYLIPTAWMTKAWPMLSARSLVMRGNGLGTDDGNKWREEVGIIQNAALLQWDHAVSSSSDEESTAKESKKAKTPKLQQQQPSDSCPLRTELKHGGDFFLLGPNAWMLVREKFGTDGIELGRPCVHHVSEESTLAVEIDDRKSNNGAAKNFVPIPPGGYFPYETMIAEQERDSEESFLPRAHEQRARLKSDVVSDEEGEPYDLFPNRNDQPDDMVISGESEARIGAAPRPAAESVMLLPPSTREGSLYPSVQDMEEDQEKDDAASGDGVAAASIFPPAPKKGKLHAQGLANMGNTCFMNSTLQCLAHTDPLRRYFLSGDYESDLNRDNPLGTGGDLATQFAQLLAEMWGIKSESRSVVPKNESTYSSSSTVYPRSFKYTLGKHAEQFMGYDQHDSQELATYLLDALHEDTNRVSKKPYIEKPEKGEDEPDEVAANKAWGLHLKREDSKVLENFMGLVKSRVECCTPGCGRVSTTFDPIMYMSVPIPGSTERTLRVTFVPLDGQKRNKKLSVTLSKASAISTLLTKVAEQLMKAGILGQGQPFALGDFVAADIWGHEVYHWFTPTEDIDRIRDSDETYIFQLTPKEKIVQMEEEVENDSAEDTDIVEALKKTERTPRYNLDIASQMKLRNEGWKSQLEKYIIIPSTQLGKVLNNKRGTNRERYELLQKLDEFLDRCIREAEKASNKRAREEEEEGDEEAGDLPSATEEEDEEGDEEAGDLPSATGLMNAGNEGPISVSSGTMERVPEIDERSEKSEYFTGVTTYYDLAMLEACAGKLRQMIFSASKADKIKPKEGFEIQIICRRSSSNSSHYVSSHDKGFVNPIVIRVPTTITVFDLRQELAKKFARCLRLSQPIQHRKPFANPANEDGAFECPESDVVPMEGDSDRGADEEALSGVASMNVSSEIENDGSDPAFLILKQVPLSYRRKPVGYHRSQNSRQLGSLEIELAYDISRPISLASQTDEREQDFVWDVVGANGQVFLEWPAQLCDRVFDETEYEASDEVKDPDEEEAEAARNLKDKKTVTILDCVEKYCQKEQLEETEMWYCNRCKTHVRAWKQFNLYRSPPILIMHLKRFQYSATSHRRDKITTFIDFPLTGFDLTGHVMQWDEEEKPIYDCYAVSNHYGGLGGGHYTAYVLNDDGAWCYYDDSRVSTDVDPKEVVTDAAYVVYYRRRDVELSGLDFLESLERPNVVQDNAESINAPTSRNVVQDNAESISVPTSSDMLSTSALQDMDVDANTNDANSHVSSRTMESNEGLENHFGDDDNDFGGEIHNNDTNILFGGPLGGGNTDSNYPLQ